MNEKWYIVINHTFGKLQQLLKKLPFFLKNEDFEHRLRIVYVVNDPIVLYYSFDDVNFLPWSFSKMWLIVP